MRLEMLRGDKMSAAGIQQRLKVIFAAMVASVALFARHRHCQMELPAAHAAGRKIDVAAQGAFAGLGFSSERIDVIGEEFLCGGDIDFSLIFLH